MTEQPPPPSRSPSPAPMDPSPIQRMPGPRAANFIRTYNDALKRILTDCNYDNFAHCFPTPAKYNPDALKTLHARFVERLGERCHDEFNVIMQERNVVVGLNDLDRLVSEARQRRAHAHEQAKYGQPVQAPPPPHTLPPTNIFYAQLGPCMNAEEAQLRAQLDRLRPQNIELSDRIQRQRDEIASIIQQMRAGVEDLDSALALVSHDDLVGLTNEAVGDEAALSAAAQ